MGNGISFEQSGSTLRVLPATLMAMPRSHTCLESNLKSRKQRVRLVIVMTARSDVPVVKITVLQQQAHVLA